ncbi:MAG: hypothetical protein PHD81_00965 [Candidatus Nanoarchaeia archaeon]|nr:hypothetical protein [Candidatus Nanoarchaeia archaeon]MDD5587661.1 hypothetical protein [Candidatus Nanoarchaeia archaeon]
MLFKKPKAIFQIIIIILSIFTIYLMNTKDVEAVGCCEKIGDKYCQSPTDSASCDPSGSSVPNVKSCSQASFCKLGTCYIDKVCSSNVPKGTCEKQNGKWFDKPMAQIPECKVGCCIRGNNCNLYTKDQCKANTPADFEMNFNGAIIDETACSQECTKQDKGCCVADGECSFTTRDACTNIEGKFSQNKFCSSLTEDCSQCKAKDHKGCIDFSVGDSTNLYWFDSCNNLEYLRAGDEAENCNYPEKTCAEDLNNANTFICRDLKCTNLWDNPLMIGDEQTVRLNGESWCEYLSGVGPTKDLPGSVHYRHSCIDGVETAYGNSYRDKICIYTNVTDSVSGITMGVGNFMENKWKDCWQQTTKTACQNTDLRDCVWTGENENKDSGAENFVYCIPMVPPGFKFWEQENADICGAGYRSADTQWVKNTGYSWHVEGNKEAYQNDFLVGGNTMCKALGDCGADYNLVCKYTNDGFSRDCNNKVDSDPYVKGCAKKLDQWLYGDCNAYKQAGQGIYFKAPDNLVTDWGSVGMITSLAGLGATIGGIAIASHMLGGFTAVFTALTSSEAFLAPLCTIVPYACVVVLAVMIIAALAYIINEAFRQNAKVTVSEFCGLWQAPFGSEDCDKCNKPISQGGLLADKNGQIIPGYVCQEYTCMSLGQGCAFEAEAVEGPTCYASNPRDVDPPIIQLNANIINITCFSGGCTVKDNGMNGFSIEGEIKEYTTVKLGISTYDGKGNLTLTKCKYDTNNTAFDQMSLAFSDGKYGKTHNLTLYNLLDGQDYRYHVKCARPSGVENPVDYLIKFTIHKAPDTTPPIVEFYEPLSGSYVKANATEQEVTITVNEEVTSCRWSKEKQAWTDMTNEMECTSIGTSNTEEPTCTAKVNPINVGENLFYFSCKDIAGNANSQWYPEQGYNLIGTLPLALNELNVISPDCFATTTELNCYANNITLEAKTSGGSESGIAMCKYSHLGPSAGDMVDYFFETNSTIHKQLLLLGTKDYTYYALCIDSAGNEATKSVSFSIKVDTIPPKIIGISRDTQYGDRLRIIIEDDNTVKCEYLNKEFFLGQGTEMTGVDKAFYAPWTENGQLMGVYYIRCEDRFGNEMPTAVVYTSAIKE